MRIMIVDDEVIIRTGLAKVIKWDELGLELLEPAASAEEAMARIPEERPNILLTDIRMTGKSGLQLADEARQVLPELEVIILSGYDDFSYAQQAIRQGVSDYLLKSSRPEDIIKTVLRAKQRVEEKWTARSQEHFRNKEAVDRVFERWVVEGETGGIDLQMLPGYFPRLFDGPEVKGGMFQVFLLSAEGWGSPLRRHRLLLFAVDNMLQDLLRCETPLQKNRIVAALRLADRDADPMRARRSLFEKIERLLKCTLFVTAGEPVHQPDELHRSYRTADRASGYTSLLRQNVWDYVEILRRKGGKTVCSREEELELSSILLEDDPVALKGWVQRIVQEQLDDPQMTLESLGALVHSIALAAHRWLERVLDATGREASPRTTRRFSSS
ncbi:response regulator [Paenibacillus sp. P25]|nr:response regulator [Paenibacillus sp. P25]